MSITIPYILSFKSHPDLQILDTLTLDLISKLSIINDKKKHQYTKHHSQILKNPKLQNMKDNIVNKLNMILNKLSENNMLNLLLDFISTIGNITSEEYEVIQKTHYIKMLNESSFIKVYLEFLFKINCIYHKVFGYNLKYFINLLENHFNYHYKENSIVKQEYEFIKTVEGESKRINLLTIVRNCVTMNVMSHELLDRCDAILLNQSIYYSDIYYWLASLQNIDNISQYEERIHSIINKNTLHIRERLLLETLVNNVVKEKPILQPKVIPVIKDTIMLETNNILEEYLMLENTDDVFYFINKRCLDGLSKNKFCLGIIEKYLLTNNNKVIQLLKILITNKLLSNTNINNGMLLYKKTIKSTDKQSVDRLKIFLSI